MRSRALALHSLCRLRRRTRWPARELPALLALAALPLLTLTEPEPLALEVDVVGEALVGEPLPIEVRLRNTGDSAIWVLPDLDGSSWRWRFPVLAIDVDDPEGERRDFLGARCGNMNTLAPSDFVRLAPGEATTLGQWSHLGDLQPDQPGTWTLRIGYDNRPIRADLPGGLWATTGRAFGDGGWRGALNALPTLAVMPWVTLDSGPIEIAVR